ncbi:MAG: hypothetical protein WCG21_04735 [Eubacteriales bacterium]
MSAQIIIALCFFIFSILVLSASFVLLSKSDPAIRKYIRISTILFITGTLLVLVIAIVKPAVSLTFIWLSEVFVFAIYAASSSMIVYFVKKFAAGLAPAANQNTDRILQNPENIQKTPENPDQDSDK